MTSANASQKPFFTDADGRRGVDRRQRPTPFLSRYSFQGGRRRTGGQRPGENLNAFVDVYSARAWFILAAILTLNFLDSHFTLLYLARGGEEANPVALAMMHISPVAFLVIKATGMGMGVLLFCVLKNFPRARLGVVVVLAGYQLLLFWHLVLYFRLGMFSNSL